MDLILATMSPADLQSFIIGMIAVVTAIIPVVAGMVILAIRNYGQIKAVWTEVNNHKAQLSGQQDVIKHVETMARAGGLVKTRKGDDTFGGQ